MRLVVYSTAAQATGASEDVMTAYLPIVLGQDALQWLRHLPHHCIDHWADFCDRFITNNQSLSDKPAQLWDLKSTTMKNRIPDIAEMAVIEDFYRGSRDGAIV